MTQTGNTQAHTLACMSPNKKPEEFAQLFDLPAGHSVSLSKTTERRGNGVKSETYWFAEHDAAQQLVARYRSWCRRSLKPPYRKQIGWERFSLAGELLDREIRYSKREDMEYLH